MNRLLTASIAEGPMQETGRVLPLFAVRNTRRELKNSLSGLVAEDILRTHRPEPKENSSKAAQQAAAGGLVRAGFDGYATRLAHGFAHGRASSAWFSPCSFQLFTHAREVRAMHYPRRQSNIKRRRNVGFRARMKTRKGRKIINAKRRLGRAIESFARQGR